MNEPINPDFENEIIAAIREPLLAAIDGADTTSRRKTRSRRILATAAAVVLLAGVGLGAWHVRRDEDSRGVHVGPQPTVPTKPTAVGPNSTNAAGLCPGYALELTGAGTSRTQDSFSKHLDFQNDSPLTCAIPYPTAVTAVNGSGKRVGLADIDHIVGGGPFLKPGGTARLNLSAFDVCPGGARAAHYQSLEVMLGGGTFPAPVLDLPLCGQGVAAVWYDPSPPPATPEPAAPDPRTIVVGDRTIRVRNNPRAVGSGVGTGVTATPDGRFVAYEYETQSEHVIATIDTRSCDASVCAETVIGAGHSPVYSAAGALAFVALDRGAPVGPNEAMWRRSGTVTVRAPGGATTAWAHDGGLQTIGWAGTTLLVDHDVPGADTEGFEELMLYRGPSDRTVLTEGLDAISPDGTRLLLSGGNGDHMLDLYDLASRRVAGSISIADYERALVPAAGLEGVDLSKWPGFEETSQWPISCCASFTGQSLWRSDLVLFPTTLHVDDRPDPQADQFVLRPTLVRISGDNIIPLAALQTGVSESFDGAQWMPGSTTDFVLKRSDLTPPIIVVCHIDGDEAHCNADPTVAGLFHLPTTAGASTSNEG